MINIRRGIFETNSSSTHSICITRDNDFVIPEKVEFRIGCFGWECDYLYTLEEKASYLYTAMSELFGQETAKQRLFETLSDIDVECDFDGDINNGYVDHASEAIDFVTAVIEYPKRLCRFLFSARSYIRTGNDNSSNSNIDITADYPHEEYYKGN